MSPKFRRISVQVLFFRIFYNTTYTILFLITIVLLAINPIDTIYQSVTYQDQIPNIFIIGGTYLATAAVALVIYSSRIYTNWRVLSDIPKSYIPVEEGEVGKSVWRMIHDNLERSAIISWDSTPRELSKEFLEDEEGDSTRPTATGRLQARFWRKEEKEKTVIRVDPKSPPWGVISHPGRSPPSSSDGLADVVYESVIPELPNLIEAKAVSLAPPDPAVADVQRDNETTAVLPDNRIVELLQRPAATGLREYLAHLASLGLINPPMLGASFLSQYEHARYSTNLLTGTQFRDLMDTFASILDGMTGIDAAAIAGLTGASEQMDNRSLASSEVAVSSDDGSEIHHRAFRRSGNFPPLRVSGPTSSVIRNTSAQTEPLRNGSAGIRSGSLTESDTSRRLSKASMASSSSINSAQSVVRHSPPSISKRSSDYHSLGG